MLKKILLVLILFTGAVNSQWRRNRYFINESEGFTKISAETFGFLVREMNVPCKTIASHGQFDYLFVKTPIDTLFKFPFIVVKIDERGRPAASTLRELIKYHYVLDTKTYYLWHESNDGWEIIIPTNYGKINIYYRTNNKNSPDEIKTVKKFVSSILLSPDTKYQSDLIKENPFLDKLIYQGGYIHLIYIFGLILIIYLSRKKRNSVVI